ncbi:MAG: phosphodiesterase [Hyphomicrobiales bacterium]|nr:phosphodiesterase [Hyphomicrobiales bacterium]
MKIIHITDFHLVAPGEPLWGLDPRARAEACLDDIARWHGDAEFCVISGDLTDAGDARAYEWLGGKLADFPLKTFVMIGNHDERVALVDTFPDVPRDANGFLQYSHPTPEGLFLFLDTRKGPVSEGEYCAKRRAWLKEQLDGAGDKRVWLFMHHPPFDIGVPYMDRVKLEEPEAFADILEGRTNIAHIFFGHVHRAAFINWRGIPCTCLPGINHQVPLNRDSVGTRYSVEPPMYGVVMIEKDRTMVHFDACLDRAPADMDE